MKIYLALPYSGMEEMSFEIANKIAAKLMREGHIVFSPISHSHPIAIKHNLPGNWEFWKEFGESFVDWAEQIHVVCIHRHNGVAFNGANLILKSKGVQGEIAKAQEQGKEICSIHYHDDDYF